MCDDCGKMKKANNSQFSTLNSPLIPPGYKQTEVGVIPEDWEEPQLSDLTIMMTNGFVGTAKSHYVENENEVPYIQGYNIEDNSLFSV